MGVSLGLRRLLGSGGAAIAGVSATGGDCDNMETSKLMRQHQTMSTEGGLDTVIPLARRV
jgi:hypothetical protein